MSVAARPTIQPSGMPDETVDMVTAASAANRSAVMKSTGRWICTLLRRAFAIRLAMSSEPGWSNSELPICQQAAPPLAIQSTRFSQPAIDCVVP